MPIDKDFIETNKITTEKIFLFAFDIKNDGSSIIIAGATERAFAAIYDPAKEEFTHYFNPPTHKAYANRKQKGHVTEIYFMADESVAVRTGHSVQLWQIGANKPKRTLMFNQYQTTKNNLIATNKNRDMLVYSQYEYTLGVMFAPSGKTVIDGALPKYRFNNALYSDIYSRIYTTSGDLIHKWDANTGQLKERVYKHVARGYGNASLSTKQKWAATGTHGGTIYIWKITQGGRKTAAKLKVGGGWTRATAFSRDDKMFFAMTEKQIVAFNTSDWKEVFRINNDAGYYGIDVSPNNQYLAFSCDAHIAVFSISKKEIVKKIEEPNFTTNNAKWAMDGRAIISVDYRKDQMRIFAFPSGNAMLRAEVQAQWRMLDVSKDSHFVALPIDRGFHLYEAWIGKLMLTASGDALHTDFALFASNKRAIVTAQNGGVGMVWSMDPFQYKKLDLPEVKAAWQTINKSEDGKAIYQNMWALVHQPEAAIKLIGAELKVTPSKKQHNIEALIDDLDADDYDKREKATEQLIKLRDGVAERLRKLIKETDSAEQRWRAREILEKLPEAGLPKTETIAKVRAMRILEWIGNDAAQDLLAKFSQGAPSVQTAEAKNALDRIKAKIILEEAAKARAAEQAKGKKKKKKK